MRGMSNVSIFLFLILPTISCEELDDKTILTFGAIFSLKKKNGKIWKFYHKHSFWINQSFKPGNQFAITESGSLNWSTPSNINNNFWVEGIEDPTQRLKSRTTFFFPRFLFISLFGRCIYLLKTGITCLGSVEKLSVHLNFCLSLSKMLYNKVVESESIAEDPIKCLIKMKEGFFLRNSSLQFANKAD